MDSSEKLGALSSLMATYADDDDDSEDEVVTEDQGRKQYNTLKTILNHILVMPKIRTFLPKRYFIMG